MNTLLPERWARRRPNVSASTPSIGTSKTAALCLFWLALAASPAALAQGDNKTNAERAQRRLQQQAQGLQQQLSAAQAAKTQADQERDAAAKKLQGESAAAQRARQALRSSESALQALTAERGSLAARLAELEKQLNELRRSNDETVTAKDRDLARQLREREAAEQGWRTRLTQQTEVTSECTQKNERLVKLGAELLQRYRDKGWIDVARQREPLLGWGDVQMFELVQNYRDRTDAERFVPSAGNAPR